MICGLKVMEETPKVSFQLKISDLGEFALLTHHNISQFTETLKLELKNSKRRPFCRYISLIVKVYLLSVPLCDLNENKSVIPLPV